MSIVRALRVCGLPATFIIDRDGRIVFRQVQAIASDDRELGQALRGALGDVPATTRVSAPVANGHQRVAIMAKAGTLEPTEAHLVQGVPPVLEFTCTIDSGCMAAVRMP